MWYLLIAAGAGYLATKWQNAKKPPLCEQNGRTRPPSSRPATPKRKFYSSLSNSTPISLKIGHDPSLGLKFLHQKSSLKGFHTLLDKDVSSSPQQIKSNERIACQDYLVNPVQVEREEDPMSAIVGTRTGVENMDDEEQQQLKEESSSCRSSNSMVIHSPVDSLLILQGCDDSFKFQGKELGSKPTWQNDVFHLQENQLNVLPSQTFSLSFDTNLEGENPRDVTIVKLNQHAEHLQHAGSDNYLLDYTVIAPYTSPTAVVSSNAAAATGNTRLLDAGIHVPFSFIGKMQSDNTRADLCTEDFACSQFSKFDARQDASQTIAGKSGSLLLPCPNVASQKASDIGDADGDAFRSFGLAMAVCFLLSSDKREMEKMGKVFGETEDFFSYMREELEERKLHLCMDDEDSDGFFTIEPKILAQREHNSGVIVNPINTNCQNGPSFHDDESIRKDLTEADVQNRLHVYDIEENFGAKLNHAETHSEGSNRHRKGGVDDGKWQSNYAYSEDDSDSEGEGENDRTISMMDLERKLWQVFQERQEERILELEEELELALSKLHAKEEELCWWKNCASWRMEQLFGSTSDETSGES